jgi:GDP/UDP-N,N'-diacetylbacillosamine 2-epimerase (hydrolysing)
MIDNYVARNTHKSISFTSLGQSRYMSALKYVDAVVGNSSSGLLEAPSFKIGTVNIGDRQKGRIKAKSVIDCLANKTEIKKAIDKIYSKKFQELLKKVKNPYAKGKTSKKIVNILKKIPFPLSVKKKFHDIEI